MIGDYVMLTPEMKVQFARDGYLIVPGLFSPTETATYRDHYMQLNEERRVPGDTRFAGANSTDPLVKYPRMLQMHRWDEISLNWLLDRRIGDALTELLGAEPFAVQTMIYFKPPGARWPGVASRQLLSAGPTWHLRRRMDGARRNRRGERLLEGRARQPELADPMHYPGEHAGKLHGYHRADPGRDTGASRPECSPAMCSSSTVSSSTVRPPTGRRIASAAA